MSNSHRSPAGPGGEPLEQEADKNLLIQQALNAILRISLEPISLDEQMHRVLDLLLKLPWLALEAQGCIYLADEEAKVLVRKAQVGMPAGALSACAQVPFGTCLCGQAIDAKEIVFASCLDARHTTLYPGIVPHGHYCVPISSGERPLGLLNLYVRDGHKRMPTEDRFLRAVADVLAGIIERQRTQERLQEQLRLAAFGRDVGLAMSQGDHLPDMLRQCAGAMVRHLDGALARIWTLNEAENVLELQASGGLYTHTDGAHGQVPVGQYKIGLIAQERKPLLTNAVLGDPRVHDQEWARREGLVAFAGYPLLVEDRLVGVMAMFARQPLSEATLEAMASVANGVALGIARVTERYRSLGSRLQLAAIVESSDDAIIGNTLDGVIWSWNRGAERLFGYSAEEARGKPIALLVPPDHPDELPGIMERLRRGERIDHYETSRVGKGGKRVEVSVSISPIQDATGKVVGASTIARDLSERRRAEQLGEANRRQEEFLALLSHELRNPLASVRHGLQVMNQLGRDDTPIDKVRGVMERQVRHLSRLVDDLLDVSRVTLGTLGLRKERVSLATVVQEAVEISRPLIEARRQGLTVSPPRQPVRWEADPVRLVQILTNLLHNAAQYTEEGGHIWLLAEREGNEVVLRVRDTGMGIPGEMLPRIFEPFQKPCPLPGHSQGGLGIGLSLVRRLVDLHGGVVEAASPGRGQGSEFVVRLPALPEQQAEAVPKAIRVSEAMPSSPKCRILVVDDDKDVAKMLATFLRLEGHEVRVAHSGHKAMEVAQEEPPDVILLDLGMPGMDGYEVAQRLRALPALKDVLLVALTGYGQEADRRRSEQAGFHGHLVKPVEPGALKQLLAHGDRGRVLGPSERAEVG